MENRIREIRKDKGIS